MKQAMTRENLATPRTAGVTVLWAGSSVAEVALIASWAGDGDMHPIVKVFGVIAFMSWPLVVTLWAWDIRENRQLRPRMGHASRGGTKSHDSSA